MAVAGYDYFSSSVIDLSFKFVVEMLISLASGMSTGVSLPPIVISNEFGLISLSGLIIILVSSATTVEGYFCFFIFKAGTAMKISTNIQQQQKQLIMRHGRTTTNIIGSTIASINSLFEAVVLFGTSGSL